MVKVPKPMTLQGKEALDHQVVEPLPPKIIGFQVEKR